MNEIQSTLLHSFYWSNIYVVCRLSSEHLWTLSGFVMFINALMYLNHTGIGGLISKSQQFGNQNGSTEYYWIELAVSASLNAVLFNHIFMDDSVTNVLAVYGDYAPFIPKLLLLSSMSSNVVTRTIKNRLVSATRHETYNELQDT